MSGFSVSCPCVFGVESIVAGELRRLGAQNVLTRDGRVSFEGDFNMLARANLWLRSAERVQIVLGSFKAESFTELFDNTSEIPFEDFICSDGAFPVKGYSIDSKLFSTSDCQSIIKKAVAKRLGRIYSKEWLDETGPVFQLQFGIIKDTVTIYLETSGQGLHKRGYRKNANAAPIRETLASAIADLARVKYDTTVYDPMCGSGTLLIESALKALNIAPGINRSFACEEWPVMDKKIWAEERERARDLIRKDVSFRAIGGDIDPKAVALTKENARKAGVENYVTARVCDIKDFVPEIMPSVVIVNPPYGERMMEKDTARGLYRTMGGIYSPGRQVYWYVITPDSAFEEIFGRKADKRRKIYNGMISCQLYMYFK